MLRHAVDVERVLAAVAALEDARVVSVLLPEHADQNCMPLISRESLPIAQMYKSGGVQ